MIISTFSGQFRFLSNFYSAPIAFKGLVYLTSEHLYQTVKTKDIELRRKISLLDTPGKAKRMGQQITIRNDWEEKKVSFMGKIVLMKFTQNPDLAKKLIDTDFAYLEEGNTWNDTFWGVCNGKGENHLGVILMEVRKTLRGKK